MAAVARKPVSTDTRKEIYVDVLRELEKRARASLFSFVKQAWDTVEKGVIPDWNWHIEAFCFHVQSMLEAWLVANRKGTPEMLARVIASWAQHGMDYPAGDGVQPGEVLVQNLVMNLPPITMKSKILMVYAPAWMWLHAPSWEMWAISAVDKVVARDSNAHRDLVRSSWYRDLFHIEWEVRGNMDAVGEWVTTAGGKRTSSTLLGGATGLHYDAIFLDDPDDAHRVHSKAHREEVQDKWSRAIKNRIKQPNVSIRIAIQQRVHISDWTSAQVEKGVWSPDDRKAWAWVVMPLLFGTGPKDAPEMSPWGWFDPRKIANDNLHPARFSPSYISDEIREKGPEGFAAQYNQNPESYDDGMIKRSYVRFFRIVDDPPSSRARPHGCGIAENGEVEPAFVLQRRADGMLDLDWLTITIDASQGSEQVKASQVGILVVGGKGLLRFVFDDRTAIMGMQTMYDTIAATVAAWPVQRVLVELKAAGSSVINDLRKRMAEKQIVDENGHAKIVIIEAIKVAPGDSKESRAAAMLSSWSNGWVYVLDGAPWLYPKVIAGGRIIDQGFISEMCGFPRAGKNDRVDAMSQLMAFYAQKGDARARWRAASRT